MPIINTDLWVLRQGLFIFMKSQNLWDFAFEQKKKKQNQKLLLSA
ncbi:Putative protein [Zobellia galactanivorans]|uniref:Uncharacterized protein n=1 Tax=Zobellia galactanivorans (strain DSM 12802 / CCUG 47099 / CIP 106680 / NCIMB 13871 / Dsij) TaxID=63186 RepID=G0L0H8_ZOBGA|nr:Putative protein [Zobellia galactanivorans]